jgi:hypothetical protein
MKRTDLVLLAILLLAVGIKYAGQVTLSRAARKQTLTEPNLPLACGAWRGKLREVTDRHRTYDYVRQDGQKIEVYFSSVVVWQRTCFINAGVEIIAEKEGVPITVQPGRTIRVSSVVMRGGEQGGTQLACFWSLDPQGRLTGGPVGYVYGYLQRLRERRTKPVFVRFVTMSPHSDLNAAQQAELELIRLLYPCFGA